MGDTIWLQRPNGDIPWGFRISGGRDFQEPIKVSRVSGGSIASTGLANGDVLLRIGNSDASCLTQAQANDIIKNSGNRLQLCVAKGAAVQNVNGQQNQNQVADRDKSGSAVHDLFQDMYRDSMLRSLPDYQKGTQPVQVQPLNNYQQSPKVNTQPASHGYTPTQSDLYNAFHDHCKPYNTNSSDIYSDYNNSGQNGQNMVYRNYKPDTSLNTSTDSGVSLGQDNGYMQRQNSNLSTHSLNNSEPSFSASTSETSDTPYYGSYSIQSPNQENLPSPPLPPPPPPSQNVTQNGVYSRTNSYQQPESVLSPSATNNFASKHLSPNSSNNSPVNALPPPPPPPLPSSMSFTGQPPSKSWQTPNQEKVSKSEDVNEFSTKLEQQLASMNMNYGGSQPTTPSSPYSPSMRGYQSPGATQHNYPQQSPHSQNSPGYHPLANVNPAYSSTQNHSYNSPYSPSSQQPHSPNYQHQQQQQHKPAPRVPDKPAMPDAVLNMAAKGGTDKKPFAYAADMDEIKHHRDKVRRKPVGIPSYQNILNLPQFDDSPTKLKPYSPVGPKPEPQLPAGPGDGVVGLAQYNTPIGLYSAENAEDAFKAQSGGVVTSVEGLPGTKEKKDITESETYKMIHGINTPKSRPKITLPAQHGRSQPKGPANDDEMTFSGVLRPTDIPSKSFHRLQSLTDHGGSTEPEIDRSSIRPNHHLGVDEGVGGYDEASIRYLGKNIPSKSFRMLQHMTGGPDQPMQVGSTSKRPPRKREDVHQLDNEKHNDEIVDISYVGGSIPSRSFKMLQQQIGEPVEPCYHEDSDHTISNDPHAATSDSRRQRRRQRNKEMHDSQMPDSDRPFDENAYLSGNVQIVSTSVNHPPPTRSQVEVIHPSKDEEIEENTREFDEEAFLSGRLGIVSDEPKPFSPKKKEFTERAPWQRDQDENSKRAELFQEEVFRSKGPAEKEKAPWERPDDENTSRERLAQINVNKGNVVKERAPWEKSEDELQTRENLAYLNYKKDVTRERAPWEKNNQTDEKEFDENNFLRRTSVDPLPDENTATMNGLSNNSFQGKKIHVLSGDVGNESPSFHSSAQYKKPSAFREPAPWEKPNIEQDGEGEFDERAFLMGKVAVVNQSERRSSQGKSRFNQVPSKTFHRLTRSVSREVSPSLENTSDYLSAEDDDRSSNSSGGNSSYSGTDIRYVGNKIPSKTFLRLHRSMERRSAEPEDENAGAFQSPVLDDKVSNEVEHVTIEKKDPDAYFDHLKESIESSRGNVRVSKVEPQAEATDF